MVKNTLKMAVIFALVILPLGTPEDIIMVPAIISAIGIEMYIVIVAVFSIYLYNSTQGKTLADKIRVIKNEIKNLF